MRIYNDSTIWDLFNEVFSYFPLVANVNEQIFCVHGGISPRIKVLDQLLDIPMPFKNFTQYPAVSDLVWGDPIDKDIHFQRNSRGYGYVFGKKSVAEFLMKNKLKLLIRAHQCNMKGIHSFSEELGVTVFSCSNYGGVLRNRCGVVRIGSDFKVYFYSLGKDTDYYVTASAIMTLDGKIGLHLPKIPQQVTVKAPTVKISNKSVKKIVKTTITKSKKKKKSISQLLYRSPLYLEHEYVKFLRDNFLYLPKTELPPSISDKNQSSDYETQKQPSSLESSQSSPNLSVSTRKHPKISRKKLRNSTNLHKSSIKQHLSNQHEKVKEDEDSSSSSDLLTKSFRHRSRSESNFTDIPSEKVFIPSMPMHLEDVPDPSDIMILN